MKTKKEIVIVKEECGLYGLYKIKTKGIPIARSIHELDGDDLIRVLKMFTSMELVSIKRVINTSKAVLITLTAVRMYSKDKRMYTQALNSTIAHILAYLKVLWRSSQ